MDEKKAKVGKPLRIAVPCAGVEPGGSVKVKVFEPHGLGGDPIETLTAKVDEAGGLASVDWTYDHQKHKDKVSQALFVFLVEGAGRTSISQPIQFVQTLEMTIQDEAGHPAAERLVVLHANRGESVPAATNAEGKLKVEVPPGDYHVELLGPAPAGLARPPIAPPVAAGAAAAGAGAALAASSAQKAGDTGDGADGSEDEGEGAEQTAAGTHWVEVRLVDPEGKPVADEAVVLVTADGRRLDATTDANGDARWEEVPDGAVELELASGAVVEVAGEGSEAKTRTAEEPAAEPEGPAPDDSSSSVAEPTGKANKHPRFEGYE